MGAGYGNGPKQQHRGEAARQGGGAQERHQPQLRHEHADDEQCLRHRRLAERRLIAAAGQNEGLPREPFFQFAAFRPARSD